jgi:electron transfer flavoprotein alpha subunit
LKAQAVILCDKDCPLAQEIAGYDLEKVIVAKSDKLGIYTPDAYSDALEQVIKTTDPQYVVMSHTYQVRDFAPKVATRFGREVVGDCIRYRVENGGLILSRRIFLGKLDADVTVGGDAPFFITFQSGAFRALGSTSGAF